MRRYWEEKRPPSIFSGSLLLRLAGGIGMLILAAMLIVRMGEPQMWRWLAGDDGRAEAEKQAARPPAIPKPTGPTHEDPDQAEMAQEEFQVLADGSMKLSPIEMEPYRRLVQWVNNQSFERLQGLARKDLLYTHFYDEPDKYRGQLATMKIVAHRALDAGECDGVQLHELVGVTSNSWSRPYFFIVVDMPKDMPTGPSIREQAEFAGYFLKLQGYQPAEAGPGGPIEKAPLLIGRIKWKPAANTNKAAEESSLDWVLRNLGTWSLALILLLAIVFTAGLMFAFMRVFPRKPKRTMPPPISATSPDGEVISIESWLEQGGLNDIDAGRGCDENKDRTQDC